MFVQSTSTHTHREPMNNSNFSSGPIPVGNRVCTVTKEGQKLWGYTQAATVRNPYGERDSTVLVIVFDSGLTYLPSAGSAVEEFRPQPQGDQGDEGDDAGVERAPSLDNSPPPSSTDEGEWSIDTMETSSSPASSPAPTPAPAQPQQPGRHGACGPPPPPQWAMAFHAAQIGNPTRKERNGMGICRHKGTQRIRFRKDTAAYQCGLCSLRWTVKEHRVKAIDYTRVDHSFATHYSRLALPPKNRTTHLHPYPRGHPG